MEKIITNNIIIAGAARAGKSTLSKIIAEKLGYSHISMDTINAGLEYTFPELGIIPHIDKPSLEIFMNISKKIAPFINTIIEKSRYDEINSGMVIDVYQLLPEDYIKYINKNLCRIFYFVTADVSIEERSTIMKTYDTEENYTYNMDEDKLYNFCKDRVEESIYLKGQCIKYNIPYYETSRDRKNVYDNFIKLITS